MDFVNLVNYKIDMDDKSKDLINEAQIINHEDLARHNSRGIYMRDDHCDWGSSGMKDLVETRNDSNWFFTFDLHSFAEINLFTIRKYKWAQKISHTN